MTLIGSTLHFPIMLVRSEAHVFGEQIIHLMDGAIHGKP